jgi:type IV secretion system protein VirB10
MKATQRAEPAIEGDRGETLVHRTASLQSRLSHLLAVGLISVLGMAALTWYYAHAMGSRSHARQSARAAATEHATGDLPLPSIGRIDPPTPPPVTPAAPEPVEPPVEPAAVSPLPLVMAPDPPSLAAAPAGPAGTIPKTPTQLLEERRLSGAVFAPHPAASLSVEKDTGVASGHATTAAPEPGELGNLLHVGAHAAPVYPTLLPAQRLLLPKGSFIDCTLETAIDSTLPGMTTCVMATDAFGVDGKVVLLERGTKLVGETRGQVQQGAARLFVLWTEARTPAGVTVPLASPGADELGRSGLPGEVNRHFWERFGAALLITVIDGAVETGVQSSRSGNGTVLIEPSASQGVMTEVLKGTINIPPTIVKRNGDRIQVLVAHDVDFRPVYELRAAAPGR